MREREELILRFLAFGDGIVEGLSDYDDRVRVFLDHWLKAANKRAAKDPDILVEYEARLTAVTKFVAKNFSNGLRKNENAKTTPRVRFDAIMIGSWLALKAKPSLVPKNVDKWLDSEEFWLSTTSSAANVRSKILGRVTYVRQALLKGES